MSEKSIAQLFLEHLGASVVKRPEKKTKQADLLASFGSCRILLEEKERIDGPELDVSPSRHGVKLTVLPARPENTVSGKIQKASKQLESSGEIDAAYRLIWYTATGSYPEGTRDQILATLYGLKQIVDLERSVLRKCYFYRNSEFFRNRSVLDGAVVAMRTRTGFEAQLCINPLSDMASSLRISPVAAVLLSGVIDPELSEMRDEAWIVDADIDRSSEFELNKYLKNKYGTNQIMSMDVAHHYGEVET